MNTEHLSHYVKDERPWGNFEQFTLNEKSTVKVITVKAGEAFSLQTHEHRGEFWHILSGSGEITVDTETYEAHAGDNFFVPKQTKHRVQAAQNDIVFLEITFGDFDEKDIIRLEDNYGRT